MSEKKSANAPEKRHDERTHAEGEEVEEAKRRLVGEEAGEEGRNRPPAHGVGDDS